MSTFTNRFAALLDGDDSEEEEILEVTPEPVSTKEEMKPGKPDAKAKAKKDKKPRTDGDNTKKDKAEKAEGADGDKSEKRKQRPKKPKGDREPEYTPAEEKENDDEEDEKKLTLSEFKKQEAERKAALAAKVPTLNPRKIESDEKVAEPAPVAAPTQAGKKKALAPQDELLASMFRQAPATTSDRGARGGRGRGRGGRGRGDGDRPPRERREDGDNAEGGRGGRGRGRGGRGGRGGDRGGRGGRGGGERSERAPRQDRPVVLDESAFPSL